ncbi:tigger transposable element-derived protein 6-like [Clytia hemisphaerica]|uniref:tigger transposable element-derived protein 6-like n=1 Tax=Clytia hemisphaerica TaxID=252671 RepID=UPI0034D7066A
MIKEKRKVILFLDNATVHPPSLVDKYSNIKVVFLPKNATSRLQPLDAGIIQSFKSKYRMKLMRFVIARTKEDVLASEIAKQVDVLQAIEWVAKAWEEVSTDTIKNCFRKCGFDQNSYENDNEKILDDDQLFSTRLLIHS